MSMKDPCSVAGGGYPSDCELTAGLRQRALERAGQEERGYAWRNCLPLAREIKLLLLDVDGVLSDGSVVYGEAGMELKAFNIKDGFGLRLLREAGVEAGIITARRSEAVTRRAKDLKFAEVHQGVGDKLAVFTAILAARGLTPAQVACMGDDWLDLPLLGRVGLAAAPADAVPEVRELAHYVARRPGGRGAVRELCELIVEAKGKREELFGRYLK